MEDKDTAKTTTTESYGACSLERSVTSWGSTLGHVAIDTTQMLAYLTVSYNISIGADSI